MWGEILLSDHKYREPCNTCGRAILLCDYEYAGRAICRPCYAKEKGIPLYAFEMPDAGPDSISLHVSSGSPPEAVPDLLDGSKDTGVIKTLKDYILKKIRSMGDLEPGYSIYAMMMKIDGKDLGIWHDIRRNTDPRKTSLYIDDKWHLEEETNIVHDEKYNNRDPIGRDNMEDMATDGDQADSVQFIEYLLPFYSSLGIDNQKRINAIIKTWLDDIIAEMEKEGGRRIKIPGEDN